MPNHCSGSFEFTGVNKDKFDLLFYLIREGKLCEHVCPPSIEVMEDMKLEDTYNFHRKIASDNLKEGNITQEEYEKQCDELKELYPYKQLWYDWRRKEWGTKWGIYDTYIHNYDKSKGYLYCSFNTAWNELSENLVQKISKDFGCHIHYERDECGMGFSGEADFHKGEIESRVDYDDAYYGKAHDCSKCGATYGGEDDEMRADTEKWICCDCMDEE